MLIFLYNLLIGFGAFIGWYFAGLGFALVLLPRIYRSKVFLLAPLLGMCLLVLIGLFQMAVLLTPIFPRINLGVLVLISLMLCFIYRNDFKTAWNHFRQREIKLWVIPFLFLLVFAWMFHNGGYHMLVGGSDQLQYANDARQMLEQVNTGSPQDIPVPRQNYFIYEMNAQTLPYMKMYRRGAEIMLATTKAVTARSYEQAFPITILCALLTLGLILGFLGQVFLRFSLCSSLVLQTAFLSSFYLLMLHIQGSLALLMSIAPGFMALALLSRIAHRSSWRWLILTIIVVAAYLSIYTEAAIVNILIPSIFLLAWEFRRSWLCGFGATRRLGLVFLAVFACAPFAIYSIVANAIYNLTPILHAATHELTAQTVSLTTLMQQWNLSAALLGEMSYYDPSAFNSVVAQFVSNFYWVGIVSFFIFCGCGLFGYLKDKNRLSYLFAFVLILWLLASFVLAYQQDGLRFARSLQYATPFALVGLLVLFDRYQIFTLRKNNILSTAVAKIGMLVLIIFIFMNAYTSARTIHFITSHDLDNDPILLRFDTNATQWQLLRNELHDSAALNAPVLLSGFKNTIWPFAIATTIRDQPHVLGKSILNFWPIYDAFRVLKYSEFNTRVSEKEFYLARQKQSQSWSEVESKLIKDSKQAVVPVGNGYPIEWSDSKDVYAPRSKRFTNIGEVIYRKEYAVVLANNMVSGLKSDALGSYRMLVASGSVIVRDPMDVPYQLIIEYSGKAGDVKLKVANHFYIGQAQERQGQIKITAIVAPQDMAKLNLLVIHAVKLRSITWMPS